MLMPYISGLIALMLALCDTDITGLIHYDKGYIQWVELHTLTGYGPCRRECKQLHIILPYQKAYNPNALE